MTSPNDTVYLVTGANRGIGLGLVKALLARPDTTVIATVRDAATAAALRDELAPLSTVAAGEATRAHVAVLDLSTAPTAAQVLAALPPAAAVPRVDVLVNNAGRMAPMVPIAAAAAADLRAAFETNAIAPLAVFQALQPRMASDNPRKQPPKVVMVSSTVGGIADQEAPGGAYGASKAALNWITRALHVENAAAGLVAVALHPGWVQTRAGAHAAEAWGYQGELPETVEGCVRGMLEVIDGATRENVSGRFVTYKGKELAW
ncbi:hypothetical protein PG999_014206 [Apiospora kogelbergensis]|uniref:Short-chain dehydrogenase n=1 Tax=Apiospora kogelbergensis TaxID=1337665 RepID=A0AAW0QMX1_9PEZI